MGGSFERLTASGKPTHYLRHSKESLSPLWGFMFCFRSRLREPMKRGFASSWLFLEPSQNRKGSPCPDIGARMFPALLARPTGRRAFARPAGAAARREAEQVKLYLQSIRRPVTGAGMELLVENLPLLLALGSAGLFAGLVAGLFGIGGGAVIVPVLYFLLGGMGFDETAQHVAVATSLATIIATSSRSVMAHHKRGAVDWGVLKAWSPWIVLGALIGMVLAGFMSGRALTILFGGVALIIALQFFFGRPDWRLADDLASASPDAQKRIAAQ